MADTPPEESPNEFEFTLEPNQAGLRLDVALASKLPRLSRSYIARLLKDGAILLGGKSAKPSYTVRGGEAVAVELPEPEIIEARPENIPLNILHEDRDLIVVNKPFGMVTHPSTGHNQGSLVNALLFHCKDLSSINGSLRPGIVHRLDKDTSGVIVAAKNDIAHRSLADQFAARTVKKEYIALCHGSPLKNEFFNDGRIGRHPTRRTEMSVMREGDEGREAYTDFVVLERFPKGAPAAGIRTPLFFVRALPRTGRTHQIRVHLAKAGFPILSDETYGKEKTLPALHLTRHALHAQKLTFSHPASAEKLSFSAPIPDDIEAALRVLRA